MEARKIIITGGATRIGAAIAEKLSGPNIEITIHYNKSKSKAESLKKKLQKFGSTVYLVSGDLSKERDIHKIIKFSKSKMKFFDCLVNNASLFENDKLENFTSKSWENHISTNLKAPAILSKEFSDSELIPASVVPFGDLMFSTISSKLISPNNEGKDNINCSTITLASSFSIPSFSAASTIFEDISKYQAGPLP